MHVLLIFLQILRVPALLFPSRPTTPDDWTASPSLHPFHEVRATASSILLTWTKAVHSIDPVDKYEIRVRWPLTVEQRDYKVLSRATHDDLFPAARVANREWATAWSSWRTVYSGKGRQWKMSVGSVFPTLSPNQRVFDFQVRAVTSRGDASTWSRSVLGHLILQSNTDRFTLELMGTGRNNPGYSKISVNGVSVLSRADLKGFAMAAFDRSDFSLVHLDTYDVFSSASESSRMASDLRSQDTSRVVAIVSGFAWEWNLTPLLATALEEYGAYYVGQWSRVFGAVTLQASEHADFAETASQDTFGHPYAFVGQAGLGMGNGIESLQLNTGHYLTVGKAESAVIRISAYYSYMLGRFFFARSFGETHRYFTQAQVPRAQTLHNPIPASKTVTASYQIQAQTSYAPYIGSLWNSVEYLMEANETVVLDEFNATNYGFEIIQVTWLPDPLVTTDPRSSVWLQTELERVWGGPSVRYSGIDHTTRLANSVTSDIVRVCPTALADRYTLNAVCTDYDDPAKTSSAPLMQYGLGMNPTKCFACTGWKRGDPLPSFSMITKAATPTDRVTGTVDHWLD